MKNTKLGKLVIITTIVAAVAIAGAGTIGLSVGIYSFKGGNLKKGKRGSTAIDKSKSFRLEGIVAINISTISADIIIRSSKREDIEVHFHGTVRTTHQDNIPQLVTEQGDSILHIYTERKRDFSIGYLESHLVLELNIPEVYQRRLTVKSVSGDLDLADHVFSILSLTTTSGDIDLNQVHTGPFMMKTTSGDLHADGLFSENSEFSSVSGDIEIHSYTGDVGVNTTSGDITLGYTEFANRVDINSTSGEVYLTLPGSAEFRLEARSTSGDISCKFPIQLSGADTGDSKHSISGDVGSASHLITVRTISGDIEIMS